MSAGNVGLVRDRDADEDEDEAELAGPGLRTSTALCLVGAGAILCFAVSGLPFFFNVSSPD
jgi:hypothetical protein